MLWKSVELLMLTCGIGLIEEIAYKDEVEVET